MEIIKLWSDSKDNAAVLEYYPTSQKRTKSTVVIFPGGGYYARARHEGEEYAQFLNSLGMDAFVLQYSVTPKHFPIELMDARRSIQWIRFNSEKFDINPNGIGVMGSSAGGHLAALVSTYLNSIETMQEDDIKTESFLPDFQILAYPVITMADLSLCDVGSIVNLLGVENLKLAASVDPSRLVNKKTPIAFIWHTSEDQVVDVRNSLKYAEALRNNGIVFELHIFPKGEHGLGLAPQNTHVAQWQKLLERWLKFNDIL